MVREYESEYAPPKPKNAEQRPDRLTNEQRCMTWHIRLGHVPMGVLQNAAKLGFLPKNIITEAPPKCPSCLYGKGHRRPW